MIYRHLERLLAMCLTTHSYKCALVLHTCDWIYSWIMWVVCQRAEGVGGMSEGWKGETYAEDKMDKGRKCVSEKERIEKKQGMVTDSDGHHFIHDMVLRLTAATRLPPSSARTDLIRLDPTRSDPIRYPSSHVCWSPVSSLANLVFAPLPHHSSCHSLSCLLENQAYLLCHFVGLTEPPHWGLSVCVPFTSYLPQVKLLSLRIDPLPFDTFPIY